MAEDPDWLVRLTRRTDEIASRISATEIKTGLSDAAAGRTLGAMKYLNMGEAEILGMTVDELGVASVAVGNLAFHLQNEFALNTADAKRFASAAKRMVADRVNGVPGFQYEERLLRVFQDDPAAASLDRRSQDSQHQADRLAYLAKQAEFAASLMKDLARSRASQRRPE